MQESQKARYQSIYRERQPPSAGPGKKHDKELESFYVLGSIKIVNVISHNTFSSLQEFLVVHNFTWQPNKFNLLLPFELCQTRKYKCQEGLNQVWNSSMFYFIMNIFKLKIDIKYIFIFVQGYS